jgi:hypothetical protein
MAAKSSVLVVANRTAMSIGLEAALRARVESGPASFTLVVPLGLTDDASATAQRMAARLREVGFDVDGRAGDSDPLNAVLELWSPASFDEIIVSTLPASTSRWMQTGLPRRIERHTGALVRHVEAREALTPRSQGIREQGSGRSREDKRRGISSVVHRFARPGAAH